MFSDKPLQAFPNLSGFDIWYGLNIIGLAIVPGVEAVPTPQYYFSEIFAYYGPGACFLFFILKEGFELCLVSEIRKNAWLLGVTALSVMKLAGVRLASHFPQLK